MDQSIVEQVLVGQGHGMLNNESPALGLEIRIECAPVAPDPHRNCSQLMSIFIRGQITSSTNGGLRVLYDHLYNQ